MSFRGLLLFALTCLIYKNEASNILTTLPQAQIILQKFLHIVETNQLNVSVVTSHGASWTNGHPQQMKDSALLLPPNSVHLLDSQLTQQVGKQWLSDLESWTSLGSGIATYRVISVVNGDVTEQLVESSNVGEIPLSPSYESILHPEQTGEDGLVEELDDYEIMYNFLIPGANGQNRSVNVFAVNFNITILDNSEHMPLTQINQIKKLLAKIWLSFDDDALRAEYLAAVLNAQVPLSKSTWQVLIGPDSFFIPSGNWVKLSISDVNVIVFALATP